MAETKLLKMETGTQIIKSQQSKMNVRVNILRLKVVQTGRRGEKLFESYRIYVLADAGDSWQ